MIQQVVVAFVNLFVFVFHLLLVARVVSSYIVQPGSQFYRGLVGLTEPLLGPVRRLLPTVPGLDLAPLAAFFLLQGVQYVVQSVVHVP